MREGRIMSPGHVPRVSFEPKPRSASAGTHVVNGDWPGGDIAGFLEALRSWCNYGPWHRPARTALGGGLLASRTWPTPRAQPPSKQRWWRITSPSGHVSLRRTVKGEVLFISDSHKVELVPAPVEFA